MFCNLIQFSELNYLYQGASSRARSPILTLDQRGIYLVIYSAATPNRHVCDDIGLYMSSSYWSFVLFSWFRVCRDYTSNFCDDTLRFYLCSSTSLHDICSFMQCKGTACHVNSSSATTHASKLSKGNLICCQLHMINIESKWYVELNGSSLSTQIAGRVFLGFYLFHLPLSHSHKSTCFKQKIYNCS